MSPIHIMTNTIIPTTTPGLTHAASSGADSIILVATPLESGVALPNVMHSPKIKDEALAPVPKVKDEALARISKEVPHRVRSGGDAAHIQIPPPVQVDLSTRPTPPPGIVLNDATKVNDGHNGTPKYGRVKKLDLSCPGSKKTYTIMFRTIRTLGSGSFGSVYEVETWHELDNTWKRYALK